MKSWALYGITRKLTEPFKKLEESRKKMDKIFNKSLNIYPIDVGNSGDLNFEMAALAAPQYNIHRFGIFFADSPRHADVLLVLGRCSEKMIAPLKETVNQLPEPFNIIIIEDGNDFGISAKDLNLPNVIAFYDRTLEAGEILSVLLNITGNKK